MEKPFDWPGGAVLEEHSRRKHKILREYVFDYLTVRCRVRPSAFRLAIVDGFAGGGRYRCGTAGSPIIFLEELIRASVAVNVERAKIGLGPQAIECLLVLNDAKAEVITLLKEQVAPLLVEIARDHPLLKVTPVYLQEPFEAAYPKIKDRLKGGRHRNVLFNLDQCGHNRVDRNTITDMMGSFKSVEIFYTFAIQSLISFLRKDNPEMIAKQVARLHIDPVHFANIEGGLSKQSWMGAAERIVFESFQSCARYVSPFTINNPDGWRYWLIHFANAYRARQVYNNILHANSSMQAHYGRSGLDMLTYDPSHGDGRLYLFDEPGRETAVTQLLDDIPRLIVTEAGGLGVEKFYEDIYNLTPAHSDDIHAAIMGNSDIEVFTPGGGQRRLATTISSKDRLVLKPQITFSMPGLTRVGAGRRG